MNAINAIVGYAKFEKLVKKNLLVGCLSLFSFLHVPLIQAADAQQALQQFVEGVQTFKARFTQVQRDERGKVLQSVTGEMWLSRPGRGAAGEQGKFRWNYQTPYQQEIVCDGRSIWYYDPDLAQVTKRSAAQALNGTPAALLSQRAALLEAFTVENAGSEGHAQTLRLLPKSEDSDFRAIELTLDGGKPLRMKFLDQLGGSTELKFSDIQTGTPLEAKLFRFVVPKGVEVVEDGGNPP